MRKPGVVKILLPLRHPPTRSKIPSEMILLNKEQEDEKADFNTIQKTK